MTLVVIIVFPFGIKKHPVFSSMNNLCKFSVILQVRGFFAGLGCFVCELEIRWYKGQVPEKKYKYY